MGPFRIRTIRVTKNDTGVQKDDDGLPREEFPNWGSGLRPGQRYLNRRGIEPFEGRAPRPTDTGPEEWAACFERILSATSQRTCPVLFSEMSLSAAAPEDMPAA